MRTLPGLLIVMALLWPAAEQSAHAQHQISELPGYDRFQQVNRVSGQIRRAGVIRFPRWDIDEPETARFVFMREGTWLQVDLETGEVSETDSIGEPDEEAADRTRRPPRGRQLRTEPSPDGRWVARCRDYNVWLTPATPDTDPDEGNEEGADRPAENREPIQITEDGHRKFRYGMASWVYGEELRQNTAMWWSPCSTMLAFYEFDETNVRDYYLTGGNTDIHTTLLVEGYPKAGDDNPIAALLVYHLESEELVRIDVGDDAEQYVYRIEFCPNGTYLLYHRTNRHQNHLELVAADPKTGNSRTVLDEQQDTWQRNHPEMRFLDDGLHFIWETEKTGWSQYELHHLESGFIRTLTTGDYVTERILRVDEERGVMFYTACSAENPLNTQLHRVNLDGTGQKRMTPENLNYTSINISPDGQWFMATAQTVEIPPRTMLFDAEGNELAVLAEADVSPLDEIDATPAELFSYLADDGETEIFGILFKPSNFDPHKKYPLLIDVYGGPLVRRVRNNYRPLNAHCEFGFIIAQIENRGTPGRGKAFEGAAYLQLGIVDIKDQVDGVRHLIQRPYIDENRVGIFGHSYGGYMAALGIVKFPDVFHTAVAGAPVTDWRNYDTIYTERFMRTPQENPQGYRDGSCLTYADQLQGNLLIMHGMVDDNVHPSNVWQLVDRLHRNRKPHDVMFFPNAGHGLGAVANEARWTYLYRHLIGNHADADAPFETADERR